MKRTRLKILIAISNAIALIFMGGCVNTVMTEEVYSPKFNPLILQKKLIINTLTLKNVKMVKL